jgi:hypothetical protein
MISGRSDGQARGVTHQLFRFQRDRRVRFAVAIAELNLIDARSPAFDDSANLAPD